MTMDTAPVSYDDIFAQRGSTYDRAMRAHPRARDAEFLQVLEPLDLVPGSIVGDVPAGGGYLRDYLPAGCIWRGHEPCGDFRAHGAMVTDRETVPLIPIPWADASVDAVVSLAGVHHLEDKPALFAEMARVVRDGGTMVVSDAREGGMVAQFLDGFVGRYNSTGHKGSYLDAQTRDQIEGSGWRVGAVSDNAYTWNFPDRSAMCAFAKGLFDICHADDDRIDRAIEDYLGTVDLPAGAVGMNWELRTIVARKA